MNNFGRKTQQKKIKIRNTWEFCFKNSDLF